MKSGKVVAKLTPEQLAVLKLVDEIGIPLDGSDVGVIRTWFIK